MGPQHPKYLLILIPHPLENLVQNIEFDQSLGQLKEALVPLRGTRIEIMILNDIKVMLFKERFVKKNR